MSVRLRIRYQYRSFLQFLASLHLPDWMTGYTARMALVTLIVVTGGLFVLQTNSVSTSGYEIHKLEQQVAETSDEIQKLQTDVASYQALASIQKRLNKSEMVAVSNAVHIKSNTETTVAKR